MHNHQQHVWQQLHVRIANENLITCDTLLPCHKLYGF